MNPIQYRLAGLLLAGLLAGCATHVPRSPNDPASARCLELYAALDAVVADRGTAPSSPARIDGFPYLRVDRFLAGFRDSALTPEQTTAWLTRLSQLDLQARRIEWASLPAESQSALQGRHAPDSSVPALLETCASALRTADLADPERLALLRKRARVSDDYSTANQLLGLYPLTMLPVDYGVFHYQQETRALFARPLAALAVQGQLYRYGPSTAPVALPGRASFQHDALGIPEPTLARLETLFAVHAPVWEIDTTTDADRPGAPYWRSNGPPTVDISRPLGYHFVSHARWQGESLLQLNYLIWFAARPKIGAFDLLGGPLDGVLWRVTLDRTGQPLLYDSIHACGCYHLLFPGPGLHLRPETAQWAEPPLVPQPAPIAGDRQRPVVRLSSDSHYVQRVYADRPGAVTALGQRNYAALYAVPVENDGRRSLFGPNGLVAGSERAERWLLWPTGVPSPGAMRERGRHAIAFVGRRHFDDADLLDRLFEPAKGER